jgi:hypothetical protein
VKIVLARAAAFAGTPSFELNLLQFFTHGSESLPEFRSFDPYRDSTVTTAYARFSTRLKVAYQDGILSATIGTNNINCLVVEHFNIPGAWGRNSAANTCSSTPMFVRHLKRSSQPASTLV